MADSDNVGNLGNNVYFYSDVDDKTILELSKEIKKVTLNLQKKKVELDDDSYKPVIKLHINSHGGLLHSGIAGADMLKQNKIPIYTFIEGAACSAATILSISGDKRYITENSTVIIHQLSGMCWGKYEELKQNLLNKKVLMNILRNLYLKNTRIPEDILNNHFFKKDICISAKQALRYGIIDKIV
jgi:ATP-dependent Clp protease protease subunit